VCIEISQFIFLMSDFYWLTTHRHLTLLLEDLCIEIRIMRPAPVILLIVNPHNHAHKHLNISSSHHLVWQGKFIWPERPYYISNRSMNLHWLSPTEKLYLCDSIISVEVGCFITGLANQYTLTSISTRYFFSWKYYVLMTLSHHFISHVTHQCTIQSHHILNFSKQSKYISKFIEIHN